MGVADAFGALERALAGRQDDEGPEPSGGLFAPRHRFTLYNLFEIGEPRR